MEGFEAKRGCKEQWKHEHQGYHQQPSSSLAINEEIANSRKSSSVNPFLLHHRVYC